MRLTVETGPLAGTSLSLDRDRPTLLGSDPDCAIRIQEAGVAPQQAVVKALKDQGFGLKALAPGVRVNGSPIEAVALRDGDLIEIGTTRIAFGQVQKRGLPQIAGFRILEEIGRGGMGNVYRAEQTSLHREVALKVLSRELTKDPAFVAKFVAEARAAAKLQHPNVVQVYDVDHDGEIYFYSMELMHDGSLEGFLKQQGTMPVERALQVVHDAATGLAYAESLGIVHRDIKPDNLMLDQHGAVKIVDLGLASTVEETEDKAIGTPHFMAPEQVLKKEIDHRTDLYALGCTFYRLVTGKTPFRGAAVKDILRAQVKDEAEPANKANPEVPAEVAAIIQKLMAKDPAARFQTANDLIEEIEALLRPPAKKGLWIGLAAVGALVAGGAIYWAVTRDPTVVTIKEKYDDPEKQQFADEIVRLKKQAALDLATIAVLRTRVSGQQGEALASALDRVAEEHKDTPAATEARSLADGVRRDLAEQARAAEQKRGRVTFHLTTVKQNAAGPTEAGDFTAALKALDTAPPDDLKSDPTLQTELQSLRAGVLQKAQERLAALVADVDRAKESKDEAAIGKATDALLAATDDTRRWPLTMKDALADAKDKVAAARVVAGQLAEARGEAVWQQYHTLCNGEQGLRGKFERFDFAGAAAAAQQFASSGAGGVAAARATDLAAALQLAGAFGDAFDKALAAGQVTLVHGGATLQAARFDRAAGQLFAGDPAKKPWKEQAISLATVSLEQWLQMVDQVAPPAQGARECFVGCLALSAHSQAARAFLGRLKADDDGSGTGPAAYPLGSGTLETLLRRLPEKDDGAWSRALRAELQAGHRLAAGLRALSEKRNLAAAGHLDKLLADHAHAFVVAVLP
ncbi:MAG: protein kinase [Planctomycetes bacterium]|nr:protein kinase [Planctomycetota bacterium]